jgi:hypothetical protein
MLRIPHRLNNRITGDDEVVSLTHWQRSTPKEHFFFKFCCRLSKPQSLVRLEGLGKLIKTNYVIGSRTCDLAAFEWCVKHYGKAYLLN